VSVVISSDFVLTSGVFPLNHARVGIDNALTRAQINASGYETGFDPENAVDGTTYDYWRPSAPIATFEGIFDEVTEIDYLGIAAHNLNKWAASIVLQHWQDGQYVNTAPAYAFPSFSSSELGDKTFMLFFNRVFTTRVRLVIFAQDIFSIGVLYIGKAFAFERPFYQGHRPLNLNRQTTILQNVSERGLDIGRHIRKKGAKTSVTVNNQTPGFMRNRFLPFLKDKKTKGFFFAWRPDQYPTDVAFCWSQEDVRPTNNGQRDLMDVTFSVDAI
jgi:hypothetical protein